MFPACSVRSKFAVSTVGSSSSVLRSRAKSDDGMDNVRSADEPEATEQAHASGHAVPSELQSRLRCMQSENM